MRFLGKLRGSGTLTAADGTIGPADYELDGYLMRPGAVVASGELHMAAGALEATVDRQGLRLNLDQDLSEKVTAHVSSVFNRSSEFRMRSPPAEISGVFGFICASWLSR